MTDSDQEAGEFRCLECGCRCTRGPSGTGYGTQTSAGHTRANDARAGPRRSIQESDDELDAIVIAEDLAESDMTVADAALVDDAEFITNELAERGLDRTLDEFDGDEE